MLNYFIKFLFIIFCFSSSFCALVEEKEEKKSKTVSRLHKFLSGCEILETSYKGSLISFVLKSPKTNEEFVQYFWKKQIGDNVYLCPIVGDPDLKPNMNFNDPKFIKKYWDYRLLFACEYGLLDSVRLALDKGADPFALDYTENGGIFSIENNGQKCGFDDFIKPTTQQINPKIVLENKFFAGKNTYGYMPKDYAKRACAIDVVTELEKRLLGGKDYKNQNIELGKDMEKLTKEAKEQEEKIEEAQNDIDIPSYEIEPMCEVDVKAIENFQQRYVYSINNPTLKTKVFFGKNFVKVVAEQDNKYEGKHLDLDSLATLYAYLIFWNMQDGTKISNLFKNWSNHEYFKNLVLYYIQFEMQNSAYSLNKKIQCQNVISIADHMVQNLDKFKLSAKNLSFLRSLFRYLFVLAQEPNGPQNEYKNLLKLLLSNPEGKLLLKVWAKEEKRILCPELKEAMQIYLLKGFIVKMLMHADPPYPKVIAENISEFWEPSEEFMKYIKKPKTKLGKVKNFFSLKKEKKK